MNMVLSYPAHLLAGPPEPGVPESILSVAGTFLVAQRVMMEGHDVQRIAGDVHRSAEDVRAALMHMADALIAAATDPAMDADTPKDEAAQVARIIANADATAQVPGTMV